MIRAASICAFIQALPFFGLLRAPLQTNENWQPLVNSSPWFTTPQIVFG